MKNLWILMLCMSVTIVVAQEKSFNLKKGVLDLCLDANVKITGYDGDKVVVGTKTNHYLSNIVRMGTVIKDSLTTYRINNGWAKNRLSRGLKPLGDLKADIKDNPYLNIKHKVDQLPKKYYLMNLEGDKLSIKEGLISEAKANTVVLEASFTVNILVPNKVDLNVNNTLCTFPRKNKFAYLTSQWYIKDYKGALNLSLAKGRVYLEDVTGPSVINTLDGYVNVEFDDESPKDIFSIITNDSYVKLELSKKEQINMQVTASSILSNLPFTIEEEKVELGKKKMKLKLNGGGTFIKVDAGYGNVYLKKN